MSPILERSSILPETNVRFVRKGEVVAYGEDPNESHLEIAERYRLGQTDLNPGNLDYGRMWVDGAGFTRQEEGVIFLSGTSRNCMPRGTSEGSRKEDARVIEEITGREVKWQTQRSGQFISTD